MEINDSILDSVKKMLGYEPEYTEFDQEILMHINSSLFTLRQLGVGPKDGYVVSSRDQTYDDFLGEGNRIIPQVRTYLYYKTKLAWDPPQSSSVIEAYKIAINEAECRLSWEVDPKTTFD